MNTPSSSRRPKDKTLLRRIEYAKLSTELANPRSRELDRMSAAQIVALMSREDARVLGAVRRVRGPIARAVEQVTAALARGGFLYFVGAGTSGRLGVLEAAECPPTFNLRPGRVQAIMAGGKESVFRSKEGAEDSERDGRTQVRRLVRRGDIVVGVAASGVTPFVRAALGEAKRRGAGTILVTCNPRHARIPGLGARIVLAVGPEVLTGSTRLKAGTACKMVLNMITTASFVRLGKAYGHWMVDLQPRSRKLVARGRRLIEELGHVSPARAGRLLREARGRVKIAILMARRNYSYNEACRAIRFARGFIRDVLSQPDHRRRARR